MAGKLTPVIDVHGHINLQRPADLLKARKPPAPEKPGQMRATGGGITDLSRNVILKDVEARLADMDGMGVDMMALTPSPPRGFYKLDEKLADEIARAINDDVAQVAADHPRRFVACGNVPLQHPELAARELERGMREKGLKGVRIGTNIAGEELGDAKFDPFWAAAERLGAAVFLHPQGFTQPDRLQDYFMANAVGQPLETTLALAQMIFGGVFERFPKLKLCAAHGGGYFPFYLGRFEQAYEQRVECRKNIGRPPSHYVKRIWFDTVVFRPEAIAYLVDLVGVEKVMMGTDSPYDMGENHPVELVERTPGLDAAQKAAILGGNARRFLGLG